jgi:hypothetical protein
MFEAAMMGADIPGSLLTKLRLSVKEINLGPQRTIPYPGVP